MKTQPDTVAPSVAAACAELGRLAGDLQAWAVSVERGELPASRAEFNRLKVLFRALHRAAHNVVDLATVEHDQGQALPDGWRP
jgi:hypothetical protein